MFNFRIIDMEDGNQIIDTTLKTPYSILTPIQMVEYLEMDDQLAMIERTERKAREEEQHRRRFSRNPFYRLACICGLF